MKLRIFTEPQQGADYQTLRAVALATEELGFDGFFRSDHYLSIGSGSGLPGPTDAWATLAALAVETSRIRLGTLMSAAMFRWPGPLAITVAQVDQMSGGRVEFGLGTGWFEGEHTATASPFPRSASVSTGSRSNSRSSPACGRRRKARRSPSPGRTTS
jgi:alkanesulfonate monooxygenase SsuD/methylene tetrahydromethanopterin reductase-like flavin-dependent oxidoreductase (luciferase family)